MHLFSSEITYSYQKGRDEQISKSKSMSSSFFRFWYFFTCYSAFRIHILKPRHYISHGDKKNMNYTLFFLIRFQFWKLHFIIMQWKAWVWFPGQNCTGLFVESPCCRRQLAHSKTKEERRWHRQSGLPTSLWFRQLTHQLSKSVLQTSVKWPSTHSNIMMCKVCQASR